MSNTIPVPPYSRYAVALHRRSEEDRKTAGGLYLPAQAEEDRGKIVRATVLAVGPGAWRGDGSGREAPQWRVGDVLVIHKPDDIQSYEWEGEKVFVIEEGDVLGGPGA